LPISAIDVITLAFEHTKRQLFQPFRLGQWTRLAIVGLLAGELGSSGGFNSFNPSRQPHPWGEGFPRIDPAILGTLITVLIVTGIVIMIVMTYISSVMRFILFDSVLNKECHIRAGWSRRQDNGWSYFLWQLGLVLVTFGLAAIIIGLPAAFAFRLGWFDAPRAHLAQLIIAGIVVFSVFAFFFLVVALVHVLTKDFVVPQMALEGISAIEGWRRLWPMIEGEFKDYAIYIGMKIALSVAVGIVVGIVTLILALIVAVPGIAVFFGVVVAGKAAGLTWNVFTITAAVVLACILFVIFFYLVSLLSVPVIVFFPAYSIYFFAARYQPLSGALYTAPAPSPVVAPGNPPPFPPPPLPAV
jgi:hypothetical protein